MRPAWSTVLVRCGARRATDIVYRRGLQDEREVTVELERERCGTEIAPIRLAPDDLEPDTLRAVQAQRLNVKETNGFRERTSTSIPPFSVAVPGARGLLCTPLMLPIADRG
jgi:hypothetical protein